MKKVKVEEKELTMVDLKALYEKHIKATGDEAKALWQNETSYNKLLLNNLKNSDNSRYCTYKVISDKLLVDDLWEHDARDMNYGLKKYNITEFVFTKNSSIAMEVLIAFMQLGWVVAGLEEYALEERYDYEKQQKYYLPKTGLLLRKEENK